MVCYPFETAFEHLQPFEPEGGSMLVFGLVDEEVEDVAVVC